MFKKFIHSLQLLSFIVLSMEVISFSGLSLIEHKWFSFSQIRSEQLKVIRFTDPSDPKVVRPVPNFMREQVLHPYVGYVHAPPTSSDAYGFGNKVSPIQTRSPNRIILGVLGGSVASDIFDYGIETILGELQKSPFFEKKEFVPIRLAGGGYKQPQQLMVLNYLLSLGAQFDILINIDGVNEVTLPPVDNLPKKVFPAYPRNWFMRVRAAATPSFIETVGRITFFIDLRCQLAIIFSRTLLRYSVTATLVWKLMDRLLQKSLYAENLMLLQYSPKEYNDYEVTGPQKNYGSEAELYEDLAELWKRSSLLLHQISVENHIRYFHFLQPNQYVEGSKKLTEEEQKTAYLKTHPYKNGVEKGYPYLIKAGSDLAQRGVNFYDLTEVFIQHPETLYKDQCCHFNEKGVQIVGRAVGQAILRDYKN